MKEAVLKVQRDEDLEDQLIGLEKSDAIDTKANPNQRVAKIPISKTEEYKQADLQRRMHMWYMVRDLRDEFDKIDRAFEARVCGIGCSKVPERS